ncbi:hypothetical protein KK060_14865 [Fulvivirgaceae bacterium PWU20]|uniref:Uncharacterized protein n=1 Tax=Chryseosolibacter indicus TaxID=2782351 RepID=A0ABS5VU34_9BACT|nr:hypothetical protein [Chryseosolibacter indicus]
MKKIIKTGTIKNSDKAILTKLNSPVYKELAKTEKKKITINKKSTLLTKRTLNKRINEIVTIGRSGINSGRSTNAKMDKPTRNDLTKKLLCTAKPPPTYELSIFKLIV